MGNFKGVVFLLVLGLANCKGASQSSSGMQTLDASTAISQDGSVSRSLRGEWECVVRSPDLRHIMVNETDEDIDFQSIDRGASFNYWIRLNIGRTARASNASVVKITHNQTDISIPEELTSLPGERFVRHEGEKERSYHIKFSGSIPQSAPEDDPRLFWLIVDGDGNLWSIFHQYFVNNTNAIASGEGYPRTTYQTSLKEDHRVKCNRR